PAGPPQPVCAAVATARSTRPADGVPWPRQDTRARYGIYYTRLVAAIPGTSDLLLGIGDATPGTMTRIFYSTDLAQTWTEASLDTPANSTVWAFGVHAADPALVFAGTK